VPLPLLVLLLLVPRHPLLPAVQVPEEDADMEGSEMEALHDQIEADYDMADMIRTKLIPNAVGW